MRADNWGECPRCKALEIVKHEQRKKDALDAYGRLSPAEYMRLVIEAENPPATNETFREDYEIGLYKDGTFRVDYGGRCQVCGLRFEYKHEERVKV